MGLSYFFRCAKCGYTLATNLGVGGFATPGFRKKILQAARNGELGEEIQNFVLENPEGVIDSANILKKCVQCGRYETTQSLTMYLPAEKFSGGEKYLLFKKYPHTCKYCGGDVEIFTEEDFIECNHNLKCPHCHAELINDETKGGLWD